MPEKSVAELAEPVGEESQVASRHRSCAISRAVKDATEEVDASAKEDQSSQYVVATWGVEGERSQVRAHATRGVEEKQRILFRSTNSRRKTYFVVFDLFRKFEESCDTAVLRTPAFISWKASTDLLVTLLSADSFWLVQYLTPSVPISKAYSFLTLVS